MREMINRRMLLRNVISRVIGVNYSSIFFDDIIFKNNDDLSDNKIVP